MGEKGELCYLFVCWDSWWPGGLADSELLAWRTSVSARGQAPPTGSQEEDSFFLDTFHQDTDNHSIMLVTSQENYIMGAFHWSRSVEASVSVISWSHCTDLTKLTLSALTSRRGGCRVGVRFIVICYYCRPALLTDTLEYLGFREFDWLASSHSLSPSRSEILQYVTEYQRFWWKLKMSTILQRISSESKTTCLSNIRILWSNMRRSEYLKMTTAKWS